jgi:hypothetical protein
MGQRNVIIWGEQVKRLDISDGNSAPSLFRANRETGALIALAFVAANWLS